MKYAIIGSVLGCVLLVCAVLAGSYISAHNSGNRMENNIVASYDVNRNTLSAYTTKVQEAAQVPSMMRDDLASVMESVMGGRYGADGSKAVFQWIQEQNPSISPDLYTNIQQIVEAGRNDFKRSQDVLIDQRRIYVTQLGTFWGGLWLRQAGYPSINLDEYDIIVEGSVQEKFNSGTDSVLNIRAE